MQKTLRTTKFVCSQSDVLCYMYHYEVKNCIDKHVYKVIKEKRFGIFSE